MLPQSPVQYGLYGAVLLAVWALGYFGSTFEGKWRRRFRDERRFYAQYRDETDRLNIEKTRRISELEAQKNALSQEVVRLRADLAAAAEAQGVLTRTTATTSLADTVSAPVAIGHAADAATDALIETVGEHGDPAPVARLPATADIATAAVPIVTAAAAAVPAAFSEVPHVETEGGAPPTNNDATTTTAAPDETTHALTQIRGIDSTLAAGLNSLGIHKVEDIEKLSAEEEKKVEIQLNLRPGQIAVDQWRLQAALIGSGEDEGNIATAHSAPVD